MARSISSPKSLWPMLRPKGANPLLQLIGKNPNSSAGVLQKESQQALKPPADGNTVTGPKSRKLTASAR